MVDEHFKFVEIIFLKFMAHQNVVDFYSFSTFNVLSSLINIFFICYGVPTGDMILLATGLSVGLHAKFCRILDLR